MGVSGYVGRVGGLAVALGVGAAVATGWACGAASAEETSSASAGKAVATSQTAKSQPKVGPRDAALTSKRVAAVPSHPLRLAKVSARPSQVSVALNPIVGVPVRASSTQPASPTVDRVDGGDASRPVLTRADVFKAFPQALPTTRLTTSESVTPDSAPVATGLWGLAAAAAGREIQTSFKAPALREQLVAPVTTGELLPTKAAEPAVASNAAAVQNSLTYTPGPALQDQITLGFLHILRALSDLTGVDLFFKVNSLLVSNAPPAILTLGLDTRQTTYTTDDGTKWKVWEFHPPNPTGRTVIALHGSGFITQPNLLHWIDYTTMARDTGATVIVPLYPLATTDAGRATVVVPDMADFISAQIEASGGAQNVSVYADSAGSTYAMGAVRQLLLDGKPVPSSIVLLSLSADFSSSNPDILKVYDPIFNIKNLSSYDSHFTDGIPDVQHSLISPLFYEPEILEHMPPTTIYVGQSEILYPDTLLLHEQAVLDNAPISVVVGTGLPHDWPSGGIPQYCQVAVVRPDIYRQLGLTHTAPRRPTLHAITGK